MVAQARVEPADIDGDRDAFLGETCELPSIDVDGATPEVELAERGEALGP